MSENTPKRPAQELADRVNYSLLMVEIEGMRKEQETLRSMCALNTATLSAVTDALVTVAEKAGFNGIEFLAGLQADEKRKHQELLESLENADPSLAARHDKRPQSEVP